MCGMIGENFYCAALWVCVCLTFCRACEQCCGGPSCTSCPARRLACMLCAWHVCVRVGLNVGPVSKAGHPAVMSGQLFSATLTWIKLEKYPSVFHAPLLWSNLTLHLWVLECESILCDWSNSICMYIYIYNTHMEYEFEWFCQRPKVNSIHTSFHSHLVCWISGVYYSCLCHH